MRSRHTCSTTGVGIARMSAASGRRPRGSIRTRADRVRRLVVRRVRDAARLRALARDHAPDVAPACRMAAARPDSIGASARGQSPIPRRGCRLLSSWHVESGGGGRVHGGGAGGHRIVTHLIARTPPLPDLASRRDLIDHAHRSSAKQARIRPFLDKVFEVPPGASLRPYESTAIASTAPSTWPACRAQAGSNGSSSTSTAKGCSTV